jgi:hypothetical protein
MSALEKTIQDFDTEKSNASFVLQTLRSVVGADIEAKDVGHPRQSEVPRDRWR